MKEVESANWDVVESVEALPVTWRRVSWRGDWQDEPFRDWLLCNLHAFLAIVDARDLVRARVPHPGYVEEVRTYSVAFSNKPERWGGVCKDGDLGDVAEIVLDGGRVVRVVAIDFGSEMGWTWLVTD